MLSTISLCKSFLYDHNYLTVLPRILKDMRRSERWHDRFCYDGSIVTEQDVTTVHSSDVSTVLQQVVTSDSYLVTTEYRVHNVNIVSIHNEAATNIAIDTYTQRRPPYISDWVWTVIFLHGLSPVSILY